jgi:hypothetical protein
MEVVVGFWSIHRVKLQGSGFWRILDRGHLTEAGHKLGRGRHNHEVVFELKDIVVAEGALNSKVLLLGG